MATIERRFSKAKGNTYRVKIRLKGFPVRSATFGRLIDARKWAQKIESAIHEGGDFNTAESKHLTLGTLIERYIREVLITKKSAKDRAQQLRWWKAMIGNYTLTNISPSLLSEYRDKLGQEITVQGKRRAPASIVRYLAALSHVFTVAIKEWKLIESNPMQKVTKPKESRVRVRFLSDDERIKLLKSCRESKNKYLYSVVVLALSTGMRQGEIMSLTWDDVDLNRGRAILHKIKDEERRVIPITGHALELIRELNKIRRIDCNYLFPSKIIALNKPIDLRAPWEAALKAAKIKDFRFHDLRHSTASYLAMNGASLAEIAEVLGHKTLQMVKRYARFNEGCTARIVTSMNNKIFETM